MTRAFCSQRRGTRRSLIHLLTPSGASSFNKEMPQYLAPTPANRGQKRKQNDIDSNTSAKKRRDDNSMGSVSSSNEEFWRVQWCVTCQTPPASLIIGAGEPHKPRRIRLGTAMECLRGTDSPASCSIKTEDREHPSECAQFVLTLS